MMRPNFIQELFDRIPEDYRNLLRDFFADVHNWPALEHLSMSEKAARDDPQIKIFPPYENVFHALFLTPVQTVKVVVIGQDPYHTYGLAHGLAFSIPENIHPKSSAFPSSLRNISKALVLEGYDPLPHGNLIDWAKQGVLLLNTVLTVPEGQAQGHQSFQWQIFTDALIASLAKNKDDLVWLLWGKSAQKKKLLITPSSTHLILTASHPSGLGAYQTAEPFLLKGDRGSCGHFKKSNEWLMQHHKKPIIWSHSLL